MPTLLTEAALPMLEMDAVFELVCNWLADEAEIPTVHCLVPRQAFNCAN
jgi:hypothetical protein